MTLLVMELTINFAIYTDYRTPISMLGARLLLGSGILSIGSYSITWYTVVLAMIMVVTYLYEIRKSLIILYFTGLLKPQREGLILKLLGISAIITQCVAC